MPKEIVITYNPYSSDAIRSTTPDFEIVFRDEYEAERFMRYLQQEWVWWQAYAREYQLDNLDRY